MINIAVIVMMMMLMMMMGGFWSFCFQAVNDITAYFQIMSTHDAANILNCFRFFCVSFLLFFCYANIAVYA